MKGRKEKRWSEKVGGVRTSWSGRVEATGSGKNPQQGRRGGTKSKSFVSCTKKTTEEELKIHSEQGNIPEGEKGVRRTREAAQTASQKGEIRGRNEGGSSGPTRLRPRVTGKGNAPVKKTWNLADVITKKPAD